MTASSSAAPGLVSHLSARLAGPQKRAVVLVAHGSRDPRAARATERLAAAVRDLQPGWWEVRASYLDYSVPRPREALASFAAAGHRQAVMVPLLLTSAYHGRVDVPEEIAAAYAAGVRLEVALTEVLGPVAGHVPALLLEGLDARLREAAGGSAHTARGADRQSTVDGVVLTAAGTRSASARASVEEAAAALGERLGVPCRVAYASAAPPLAGDAVRELQAAGCRRIGLSSYFLAPGRLWDATVASAREAGVAVVTEPLTDSPALAALVAERVTAVECVPRLGVAA